jgi:phosphoheptose isomerase
VGEADELLREALEANRARELLFRREAQAIVAAAKATAKSFLAGRALYVIGSGELSLVARWVAHALVTRESNLPLRAAALGLEAESAGAEPHVVREVRAFVERGDVLLAFAHEGTEPGITAALDVARARGAAAIAVTGYPGEALLAHADSVIVIPSRQSGVIAETVLSIGHVIGRVAVARVREGGPIGGQSGAGLTADDDLPASLTASSSSEEAVIAELVESTPKKKRHVTSSVELVPLYVQDEKTAAAPAPPNMVRFQCTNCGEQITVDAKFAGRAGQCPNCLADFVIPKKGEEAAAAPAPAPAPETASTSASGARRDPSGSAARRAADPSGSAARRAGSTSAPPAPARPTPAPVAAAPAGADAPPQVERRRAGRVNVRDAQILFAKETFPGDDPEVARHGLENISLTGLSLIAKAKAGAGGVPASDVKVGDVLFLLLDFPAFVDKIRVQGEVRRVALLPDRSGFAIGVRFSRFLEDAQAKVRRLVENGALRGVKRR